MSIICGDCLEEMRKMGENSISAIVTDPPYGLSFMGKGWDYAVPDRLYWAECYRIMVPGSFLIAMGGTRTFHRLTCAIEDAGLEIRDCISWLYGSGFPKSHNQFGLKGYGTALKPAWEPCIVAMKPLDGTFKQNAEKWGQAGINIDGCRIGEEDTRAPTYNMTSKGHKGGAYGSMDVDYSRNGQIAGCAKGRWPANVILDEEAAKMLDEQSGVLKSGSGDKHSKTQMGGYQGGFKPLNGKCDYSADSGGASRFFYCAKASSSERNEGLELVPIATDDGRNIPIDNAYQRGKTLRKNSHPTVKPLKLMEYLIKLVMPPKDGILLDPFAGSGTTILAAHNLGMKALGIEQNPEYCEIARARLENAIKKEPDTQLDLFKFCG